MIDRTAVRRWPRMTLKRPRNLDRLKTALSDRYAIEEELGAGGMATVYQAP